jgi:hypothetical protein
MYLHIRDLWGPTNLVVSMVTELDDTLPCFTDVQWDSVWATHGCPSRLSHGRRHLGEVGLGPNSLIVTVTPSNMGEGCSLSPNVEVGTILLVCWDYWMMLTTLWSWHIVNSIITRATFAWLALVANLFLPINSTWLITCLKVISNSC